MNYTNLSNSITIGRIALIIPIVICHLLGQHMAAWYFLLIAALSDLLDGYIARKLSVTSKFGALLDSYSDKMLVITMFILLIANGQLQSKFHLSLTLLIIFREFLVLLWRIYLYTERIVTLHATVIAKIKTGFEMLSILSLLYPTVNQPRIIIGQLSLVIATILALVSGVEYCRLYYRQK